MKTRRKAKRSCFVVAPIGADISNIRSVLEDRRCGVLEWENLFSPGRSLYEALYATVKKVDLVVAVIVADAQDANVLVAVGVARAVGKRLLILSSAGVRSVPELLQDSFILPVDSQNAAAIGLAVDRLLASSKPALPSRRRSRTPTGNTLGDYAEVLLKRVRAWSSVDSATRASHEQLESIVRDTLNALHLSAVASSERSDVGADFAVWDDALESLGTPILIEVKTDVRGPILQQAQGQLQRQLEKGNASFGLLLWGIGPHPRIFRSFQRSLRHQVFSWSVEDFIKSLRSDTFADVVLSLASSTDR